MTDQQINDDTRDELEKHLTRIYGIAAIAGKLEAEGLPHGVLPAAMWAITDEIELVQQALGLTATVDVATARPRRQDGKLKAVKADCDRPEGAA